MKNRNIFLIGLTEVSELYLTSFLEEFSSSKHAKWMDRIFSGVKEKFGLG